MQVIVDGLYVNGLDTGKGKVALLLHGWGSDHTTFLPLIDSLEDYRVIAPSLPGFGGSEIPPEAWGVEDYAEFIEHLLKKLDIKKVDIVIGHSFGGRIALELLARRNGVADKLVLLASHGLPEKITVRGNTAKALAKVGKGFTFFLPESTKMRLRRRLYKFAGVDDYLESGVMRETFKEIIKQDVTEAAPKITVPTLLLYGEDDKITPPMLGRRIAALVNNSEFHLVSNAGHFLHRDQPEIVLDYIRKWAT